MVFPRPAAPRGSPALASRAVGRQRRTASVCSSRRPRVRSAGAAETWYAGRHVTSTDEFRIPTLLQTLVASGRWKHPGDQALRRTVPLLVEPLEFRSSLPTETVARELEGLNFDWNAAKMYRDHELPRSLPWLNADRAKFIAVNRVPGDDVAIAFDYRADTNEPRVVASHWREGSSCEWFEVAETFEEFARLLGLVLA